MAIKTYKVKAVVYVNSPTPGRSFGLCEPPGEETILIVSDPGYEALMEAFRMDCLAEFDASVNPPTSITLKR